MNPLEAYLKDLPPEHPARVEYAKIVHQADGLRAILSAALTFVTKYGSADFHARLITQLQTAIAMLRPKEKEAPAYHDGGVWKCRCGHITNTGACLNCRGQRKAYEVRS